MKNLTLLSIAVIALTYSSHAFAKGGGGGKGGPLFWLGLGGGSIQFSQPKNKIDADSTIFITGGLEGPMFGGPVCLTFGVMGNLSRGQMDYDYTDEDSVHYTASDVDYYNMHVSLTGGLKFRIYDSNQFRVYIEGGGFYGSESFTYDAVDESSITAAGSKYIKNEASITSSGYYAEFGLDFMTSDKGFRVAARQIEAETDKIKALDKKAAEYSALLASISLLKEF